MNELRSFFETLALEWDNTQPPDRDVILNQLLMPFSQIIENAKEILEVGTGTGALIPHVKDRAAAANLISIDLAEEMLRRAKQHHPKAIIVQADVHNLPFVTPWFDLVICHNSFPHFTDKTLALNNLLQAIRPEGCLLILHDLGREQVNAIHQSAQASIIHADLLPTGDETQQMLIQAGFSNVQVWDEKDRFVAVASRKVTA